MKQLEYQQKAVSELIKKTICLLNNGESRSKIVFEAPTGSGKTVMACQALAGIVDELQGQRRKDVAFIWFAPRKLHLQSYCKLKNIFTETRKLRPVMFDELEQSEGIRPGEILFVNWESVNKKDNLMVRDNESSASLYEIARRTQEERGLPIVAVIDEEHMFWSKTADKSAEVLERINPMVELRMSATPKTAKPKEKVTVYRRDVIEAEMIKKDIVLNPDIELDFSDELELNENLIKVALEKRNQIADAYKGLGLSINPLLLIQLPNDTKESMTAEDSRIAEQVKEYLEKICNITEKNGRLAVWLANEKSNLPALESNDNMAEVLLFKEAIALGWDCPRAAVLLIFRKLQSTQFTVQTVGRILRMPEHQHYSNELLNTGYVYTDIAKDKIQIVAEDASYILNNALTAHRRERLKNVSLKAYYSDRPNVERNYLGPDFKKVLYQKADTFFKLNMKVPNQFSLEELSKLYADGEADSLSEIDNKKVEENRHLVTNMIKLDVRDITLEIPKDVHFQNEEQTINKSKTTEYARKPSEIDRMFMAYISTKGHQFESKGRSDKIAAYLLEMMDEYFGVYGTDAKKVVLYDDNCPKFDKLLDDALDFYAKYREKAKKESAAKRVFKSYQWEVPEERIYDSNTNKVAEATNHALQPFIRLNAASQPEKDFEAFLEKNKDYIDWWYKNGDVGKQNYAIEYIDERGTKKLFYVDFVIRMKDGVIYLFDTKSKGSDNDAPEKHEALLKYIKDNSTRQTPLSGGIIIQQGKNWLYPSECIKNTENTSGWTAFYPAEHDTDKEHSSPIP